MWILILLLLTGIANADVYVVTDNKDGVYSLSDQNDAVIPKGYNLTIIKGNISNLPISGDPTLYNFKNGSFTLNTGKVQAQQKAQSDAIGVQTTKDNAKASAIAKLKVLGLTDAEIQAVIGQ